MQLQKPTNARMVEAIIHAADEHHRKLSTRVLWQKYETFKKQIQFLALDPDAYDEAIRRLVRALGL